MKHCGNSCFINEGVSCSKQAWLHHMEDAPLTLFPTETAASASPHHVIVLLFSGPMAAHKETVRQLGQAPTSSHYSFFHQSQEDQLGNWRAQVSQLTLVSHAVCPALSHKDGVPMCSPIGTTHLSGAWWCSQQPLGTLWQWGSSPWLPSGRHCWRCRDLLSPE